MHEASDRLKIGFICGEYPPGRHGGIGTFTRIMGRALAAAGHEVRVVGLCAPDQLGAEYEEDEGVRVWRMRLRQHRFGLSMSRWELFRVVAGWSRRGLIDLIELPDYEGWAAWWPRLRVPVVSRLHGSLSYFSVEMGDPPDPYQLTRERASLRRSDFWCSVSCYADHKTRKLFNLSPPPSAIFYNPVELVPPGEGPRSRHQVLFTGTLAAKKGVISLVRAWPEVVARCPEAELHVYGKDCPREDGSSMKAYLLSLLEESVRPSVRFYGHVTRETLFDALRKARAAVFPSYVEAFAIAPLEAMSTGCPTISSTRSSGPELMEGERYGLLVDPDRPGEIADAILRVLQDDRLADRLGRAGRERVCACYSIETLARANEAYYRDCIQRFRRGATARNEVLSGARG